LWFFEETSRRPNASFIQALENLVIKRGNRPAAQAVCIALLVCTALRLHAQRPKEKTTELAGDWTLQSSASVHVSGDVLSTSGYQSQGWTPIQVPTTVVAALVKAKIFPDPTVAMNLRKLPGVEYQYSSGAQHRCGFAPE
jgi:hypothetical protein